MLLRCHLNYSSFGCCLFLRGLPVSERKLHNLSRCSSRVLTIMYIKVWSYSAGIVFTAVSTLRCSGCVATASENLCPCSVSLVVRYVLSCPASLCATPSRYPDPSRPRVAALGCRGNSRDPSRAAIPQVPFSPRGALSVVSLPVGRYYPGASRRFIVHGERVLYKVDERDVTRWLVYTLAQRRRVIALRVCIHARARARYRASENRGETRDVMATKRETV